MHDIQNCILITNESALFDYTFMLKLNIQHTYYIYYMQLYHEHLDQNGLEAFLAAEICSENYVAIDTLQLSVLKYITMVLRSLFN